MDPIEAFMALVHPTSRWVYCGKINQPQSIHPPEAVLQGRVAGPHLSICGFQTQDAGRVHANVDETTLRTFVVECDNKTLEVDLQIELLLTALKGMEPSYAVYSGNRGVHFGFTLDHPAESLKVWKAQARAFGSWLGKRLPNARDWEIWSDPCKGRMPTWMRREGDVVKEQELLGCDEEPLKFEGLPASLRDALATAVPFEVQPLQGQRLPPKALLAMAVLKPRLLVLLKGPDPNKPTHPQLRELCRAFLGGWEWTAKELISVLAEAPGWYAKLTCPEKGDGRVKMIEADERSWAEKRQRKQR